MSIDLGGADGSEWRDREENLIREQFHTLEERLSNLEEGRDKVRYVRCKLITEAFSSFK